ncbi:hypothetical protein [uncultured Gilvimarinus sp.]|uniref:hypothetical protein n=1 Tax=uncultured Gilvimarinus sp. TaxID=1689143 RepID=UPI0030ECFF3A
MRIQQLGSTTIKLTSAIALCLGLAACGGSSDGTTLDQINGQDPGGEDPSTSVAQIGYGSGADFVPGEIGTETNGNALSAGGSTTLTVNVVQGDELITDSTQVTFNSPCIASGESLVEPIGGASDDDSAGNVVDTSNGQAGVRYTANGCIGSDSIKATTTYGGGVISATTELNIESDTVTSINFADASPNYIALKGTGGTEASQVRFQIRGTTGAPVKGVEVSFALNTTAGGLSLVNASAVSGSDGYVSTTVQSGTTPTSVRVTATTDTGVTSQSNELIVSTGLPDQNSMSIAASDLYPIAWSTNNVLSQITVNLADAFNNPVPNRTPVYFTTNGGSITASCLTGVVFDDEGEEEIGTPGVCTATWRSQKPQLYSETQVEMDEESLTFYCPNGNVAGRGSDCRNGRVKIIATTIGNESFVDINNNGMYDLGTDLFYTASSDNNASRMAQCKRPSPISGASSRAFGCDDLGSAYIDRNFNGEYDSNEEVASINDGGTGEYVPGDGIYNGSLCREEDAAAGDCSRDSVLVRDDIMLITTEEKELFFMPGSNYRLPGQPAASEQFRLQPGGSMRIPMMVADVNGNGLPKGTEIAAETTGEGIEASVSPEGELAGNPEGTIVILTVNVSESQSTEGTAYITVTVPTADGEESIIHSVGHVNVISYSSN